MPSPKNYPIFRFRISNEQYQWLKDYAKRHNTAMSAIIKDHLNQLQRKDKQTQHNAHKEALDG